MAPPVESFRPKDLESKLQRLPNGHTRKPQVNLKDCELLELMQYNCNILGRVQDKKAKVICEPVLRVFRRCADGLTVETTEFEGIHD